MNLKSLVIVISIATVVSLGEAKPAEARGFGNRGGTSVRLGMGRSRNGAVRYFGPSFAAGPRSSRSDGQGSTQYQQRPWYYSRSGPITYYRPYNPLYRTR